MNKKSKSVIPKPRGQCKQRERTGAEKAFELIAGSLVKLPVSRALNRISTKIKKKTCDSDANNNKMPTTYCRVSISEKLSDSGGKNGPRHYLRGREVQQHIDLLQRRQIHDRRPVEQLRLGVPNRARRERLQNGGQRAIRVERVPVVLELGVLPAYVARSDGWIEFEKSKLDACARTVRVHKERSN